MRRHAAVVRPTAARAPVPVAEPARAAVAVTEAAVMVEAVHPAEVTQAVAAAEVEHLPVVEAAEHADKG